MSAKRPLGEILLESGRITQDDVERVLEYQRSNGGFFGQALVALGVVSREEIDWALANQFDLPFIFPNADAVDRDAARLVPADWALAHLAVPIVRAGRVITVVVADPLDRDTIEDLRSRTGCDVEMALASATRIRELIHQIYDDEPTHRSAGEQPVPLTELISTALEHGAERFGLSIRGTNATGWWRTRHDAHRAPLADGWEKALVELFSPSPLEQVEASSGGRSEWSASLRRAGPDLPLVAQALVGVGGCELLFRPVGSVSGRPAIADITLPPSLVTELRLLWRGGSARIGVGAAHPDMARVLLPQLPLLALGEDARAAHITASDGSFTGYTLRAEAEEAFADSVAACELDALTIDLPVLGYPVRELLRAAPLSFMLLDEPEERSAPGEWGINWLLTIEGTPGSYAWDLRALHR